MQGETIEVNIEFLYVEEIRKYFQVKRKWWINKGARTVATAEILEILS